MIKDLQLFNVRIKTFFQKTAGKKRIGFICPRFPLYSLAMASTRLRVYDPILWFENDKNCIVECFNPHRSYDVVIFQKYFDDTALALAKRLKEQGTVVVLDINVNYYTSASEHIEEVPREQVYRFTDLADCVIAVSPALKNIIESKFPRKKVFLIEEAVPEKFFQRKVVPHNPPKTFLWIGYGWKVTELELIKDLLSRLAGEYGVNLLTIGGNSVDLGEMKVKKFAYREWSVHKKMRAGDVFISPRDLSDPYNLTHAFTKIGIPMAMGIPVVASPIPSYKQSPALLCATKEDWEKTLIAIAAGEYDLHELGKKGSEYVWKHYRPEKIKEDYKYLFNEVCNL